ncbi:hypothetical protein LEP1GSC052_3709 [Leptospira kmetyi serovar Malaysia str. Bejo-Iso9]|nr:hypothetical protein LEP1GSC052_3709 [Leptospira kmetyi serovar Malaysia str. Bejo-Iso9]
MGERPRLLQRLRTLRISLKMDGSFSASVRAKLQEQNSTDNEEFRNGLPE